MKHIDPLEFELKIPTNIFIKKTFVKSKMVTQLSHLSHYVNLLELCKEFSEKYNCNGILKRDSEYDVLQFTGDQCNNLIEFLTDEKICKKGDIKVLANYLKL